MTFLNSLKKALVVCAFACGAASAYTVVTLAPGTPATVEQSMIASTTTQFNSTLLNSSGINILTLKGLNPLPPPVSPPLSYSDLLAQINLDAQYMATVDSYTYASGWGNGMTYYQNIQINRSAQFTNYCSSATFFYLTTIDSTTCTGVLVKMMEQIEEDQNGEPVPPQPGNY